MKSRRLRTCDDLVQELNIIIEQLISHSKASVMGNENCVKVEELAKELGITSSTLRRWCAKHLKQSPYEYLEKYRAEKAIQLLRKGEAPSSVARQLGFTEHKVFSTTFKRITGATPISVRKTLSP